MMPNNDMVRYTASIPSDVMDFLRSMVQVGEIASVNAGIKEALADFEEKKRTAVYYAEMAKASKDTDFIERTEQCMKEYQNIDGEEDWEW